MPRLRTYARKKLKRAITIIEKKMKKRAR